MGLTGLMLAWSGFGFADLLNQLESMDFFSYVLPFLLIFAVVYAVLTKIHVFEENKGAAVIVAFAIGLMSLQLGLVSNFFTVLFPRAAIGISLLLVALILAGAFIGDDKKSYKWIFFGLGSLIFIIIAISSFSDFNFIGSGWWDQYGAVLVVFIFIIAAIVAVISVSKKT